jgi:zinc D-Ala-D-Ala dipeptidase
MNSSFLKIGLMSALFTAPSLQSMSKAATPELVNIKKINSTIGVDVVYATDKNFTGKVIYKSAQCYVLKEVAQALNDVQKELEKKNLGLVIWDGYRPMSAQKKLWDVCAVQYPDENERENYVSNPAKGGRHTRGTAVDVTLKNLQTGQLLEMPTAFDHFGKEAWRNYEGPLLTAEAKKNRALLEEVMTKHGFIGLPSEWWHFDFNNWKSCPPLDIEI